VAKKISSRGLLRIFLKGRKFRKQANFSTIVITTPAAHYIAIELF